MKRAKLFQLTDEERDQLWEWASGHGADDRLKVRANVILASADGVVDKRIKELHGMSRTSINKWRERFLEKRLDGLRDGSPGRPPKATATKEEAVVAAATARRAPGVPRPSGRSLARAHGLSRSVVHRILKNHGIRLDGKPARCTNGFDIEKVVQTEKRYEIVTVALRRFGRRFPFKLCKRKLDMGSAGEIDYYWMDSSGFRHGDGGINYRSCVDLWCAETKSRELGNEDDVRGTLVFAECYPKVSTSRSLQDVFLDAHLSRARSLPHDYSLPPQDWDRLRSMASSRDVVAIRDEFRGLFVGEAIPEHLKDDIQRTAEEWLGQGVKAFLLGDGDGLRMWIDSELMPRIQKLRKRGAHRGRRPGVPLLLNAWVYNCKVSFYTCYANAWGCLLGELESQGLDVRSSRFMRLWHMQNPNEAGEDVFWGQVLALHPLSGRIMLYFYDRSVKQVVENANHRYERSVEQVVENANYREAIGRWLKRARPGQYDAADYDCNEYWDLVTTILAAAYEYKHLHEASLASKRGSGKKAHSGRAESGGERLPDEELFDAYAHQHHLNCPSCGELLRYESGSRRIVKDDTLFATFATFVCGPCGHRVEEEILDD